MESLRQDDTVYIGSGKTVWTVTEFRPDLMGDWVVVLTSPTGETRMVGTAYELEQLRPA